MADFDAKDGGLYQQEARQMFLRLFERLVPDAKQELIDKPFGYYAANEQVRQYADDVISLPPEDFTLNDDYFPEEQVRFFLLFYESFRDWIEKYNFNGKWLEMHLISLFESWHRNPSLDKYLFFPSPLNAFFVVGDHWKMHNGRTMRFEFSFPAFRFNEIGESEYKKAIAKAFQRQLKEYFSDVKTFAKANYQKNPKPRKLEKHLKWFILYQVKRKTYSEIAQICQDEKGIDEAAVIQAVHNVAELLGITLREGSKRGRKRKT